MALALQSLRRWWPLRPRPIYRPGRLPPEPALADLEGTAIASAPFVVFDTETTGLHPSLGDEIVSIAGVRVVGGAVLRDQVFDSLVQPGRPIPLRSTLIHGITDEAVAAAPRAPAVLRDFHAWCGGAVLVAHNAAFDMRFLELKQEAAGVRFEQAVLDTLLLSAALSPREREHDLDNLALRWRVDLAGRHSALGDALATADVFVQLCRALAGHGIASIADALRFSRKARRFIRLQRRF